MRYVIKSAVGYFTEMVIDRSEQILAPMDMVLHQGSEPVKKGAVIGVNTFYKPQFDALRPFQAVQFDTEKDAQDQIKNLNPDGTENMTLGGAAAFAGCAVEPSA
jgi:hypothetical protein